MRRSIRSVQKIFSFFGWPRRINEKVHEIVLPERAWPLYNSVPGMGRIINLVRAYQQAQDWDQREQVGLELRRRCFRGCVRSLAGDRSLSLPRLSSRKRRTGVFSSCTSSKSAAKWTSSPGMVPQHRPQHNCRTSPQGKAREGRSCDSMSLEEIAGVTPDPMATGGWLDLEYAKKLLQAAKPPCNNYLYD